MEHVNKTLSHDPGNVAEAVSAEVCQPRRVDATQRPLARRIYRPIFPGVNERCLAVPSAIFQPGFLALGANFGFIVVNIVTQLL